MDALWESPPDIKDYKFVKPLGSGAYGKVYLYQRKETLVAVKIESGGHYSQQLLMESRLLKDISEKSSHFPKYFNHGLVQA